ncbi:MAG: adenosylhomocysteinase [Firmicutes bacterium]|nr:adenosylhomocysteinase [Bacillota bacterium]
MAPSLIRDPSLADEGDRRIGWVMHHMPVLSAIREDFLRRKPFQGLRIGMSIHLEAKTAYLALVLRDGGAQVAVTGSNPLSTQDAVAAALARRGVAVYAWHGATAGEYRAHLLRVLDARPQLILDDGGDLTHLLHTERKAQAESVWGGTEETTTGVLRLRAMERAGALLFPVVAVNDAYCKYLFDNRYGTGQSVWDGILRTTNLVVAGKTVVVAGYGWCGRGVARRAEGLGARVIVTEVDPIRALEALMDGYQVMRMAEAAQVGDFFITVTGDKDVIVREHFLSMKDGAILANAGHFDVEVSVRQLAELAVSRQTVRENIEEFALPNGRRVYLLGEGRLVNLACGDGHPAEIMDMSFALQARSLEYLAGHHQELKAAVWPVPPEIDRQVAMEKLQALGVRIDQLTPEQQAYLNSWA